MEKIYYDKNGYPVCCGDVLRVFHFIGPRRKRFYMWKVVMENYKRRKGMVAADIRELATLGADECHVCDMEALGEFEIVDGMGGFGLRSYDYFTERPKRK